MPSIIDDDGHYSDIHGIIPVRDSIRSSSSGYDHYHRIGVNRVNAEDQSPAEPGCGDLQAARPRGYEGLDPSVLDVLRQAPRPHDYVGLAAGEAAASAQQTTEAIEMTVRDNENTVSIIHLRYTKCPLFALYFTVFDVCRVLSNRAGNGSLELTHDPLTHLMCDP